MISIPIVTILQQKIILVVIGHAEIRDEMLVQLGHEDEVKKKKGYIFYHTQETDSIRAGDRIVTGISRSKELPIYLNFNAYDTFNDNDKHEDEEEVKERCKEMFYKLKVLVKSHNMRLDWEETMTKKMILYVIL